MYLSKEDLKKIADNYNPKYQSGLYRKYTEYVKEKMNFK